MAPKRPSFRYHGAKWRIAEWIIKQFPPHTCYVEPFAGAASLLMKKSPAPLEVINDLNSDVVNFFDVLRTRTDELVRAIELTPWSREVWSRSFEHHPDPLENALRFYVRATQSFGASESKKKSYSGWRTQKNMNRGSTILKEWNTQDHLFDVARRLKLVQIENQDALSVIKRFDAKGTLFYVDPPYVLSTRENASRGYSHEMTDDEHRSLISLLQQVQGMVIISGYRCELYDQLLVDWRRLDRGNPTNGQGYRIESIWINHACVQARGMNLFTWNIAPAQLAADGEI
jgi:DNA adenine methylase